MAGKIDEPAFAAVGALVGVGGVEAYVKKNPPLSVPLYVGMGAVGAVVLYHQEGKAMEALGGALVSAGIWGTYKRLEMGHAY